MSSNSVELPPSLSSSSSSPSCLPPPPPPASSDSTESPSSSSSPCLLTSPHLPQLPEPKELDNTIFGSEFVQEGKIGSASYHFESPDLCYINYENAPESWKHDDNSKFPHKKPFLNPIYDPARRTFTASVDWSDKPILGGVVRWEYRMVFSADFSTIFEGEVSAFDARGVSSSKSVYGIGGILHYKKVVSVTPPDPNQELLHIAIIEQSIEKLNEAVANGADVNFFSSKQLKGWKDTYAGGGKGNSALHFACWLGCGTPFVERLLELGAIIALKSKEDEYTPFHLAACSKNVALVTFLLEKGCNTNEKDSNGLTPIQWASRGGCREIVLLLLDNGANILDKDKSGNSSLHRASSNGCTDVVELLLDRGSLIHEKNDGGCTSLHYASSNNCKDVIELLLNRHSNIHEEDSKGYTSLHYAASYCYKDIIEMLIDRGADVNKKDCEGSTALHLSCIEGKTDVIKLLIDRGANVFEKDTFGCTALHWLTQKDLTIMNNNKLLVKETICMLLDKGLDINEKDSEGYTPLLNSAIDGHKDMIIWLLDRGAKIDDTDEIGYTALHWSSQEGKLDAVELLLDRGLNIHDCNNDYKYAPIHLASLSGQVAVTKLLLDRGSNVNERDVKGCTSLLLATSSGHKDIVELLLERGAEINAHDNEDYNCLHWISVIEEDRRDIAQLLLDGGCDPLKIDVHHYYPIHWAAQIGNKKIAELLLERAGATISARTKLGYTPLHCSASTGQKEIVEMLLRVGSDIHENDEANNTPFLLACQNGHREVVEFLLDRGSNISDKGDKETGFSGLLYASQGCHKEVISLLLDRGLDVNEKSPQGFTPLMCVCSSSNNGNINQGNDERDEAEVKKQTDCVEYLLERGSNINEADQWGYTSLHWSATLGHRDALKLLISRGCDFSVKERLNMTPRSLAVDNYQTSIVSIIDNWPASMAILVLQELLVYNQLDLFSFYDMLEFIGIETDFIV